MNKIEVIIPAKIGENFILEKENYQLNSVEINKRGTFYVACNLKTKDIQRFTITIGLVPVGDKVTPLTGVKIAPKSNENLQGGA